MRSAYRSLRDRLIILAFIDSFLTTKGVWTYTKEDYQKHVKGKSEHFLENIAAINEICAERGILFIVLKQQATSMSGKVNGLTYEEERDIVMEKLESGKRITYIELSFLTHTVLNDALDSWTHSNSVPMMDVVNLLNDDRDVLLSWVHLSPRGNKMIAQALAADVLRYLQ